MVYGQVNHTVINPIWVVGSIVLIIALFFAIRSLIRFLKK
ncbi:hypothetical protein BCSJ1_06626 [Bacillus cereus SJ1]|nr:hypothetical protein BCSJ1_06626 [Bacillus cereus SJ1]PRP94086.1 hypothetical protein TUN_42630 [Bacillus sp. M21]